MLVSELYLQFDNLTRFVKNMQEAQNSSTAEYCSYERCTAVEATLSDLTEEIANITSILNSNSAGDVSYESNNSNSTTLNSGCNITW